MPGVLEQLRNHSVAIVSLAVALSALGYTTWRNERTELNRNVREAGFHLLTEVGSLQQVVFYAHFTRDDMRGELRMGWADTLSILDLAALMPAAVGRDATLLREAWQGRASGLGSSDEDFRAIDDAIDRLRQTTLTALRELD